MTSFEMEMRVRERRQQMLEIVENDHLLSLAPQRPTLRVRFARVLLALGERLDPQLRRAHSAVPCTDC